MKKLIPILLFSFLISCTAPNLVTTSDPVTEKIINVKGEQDKLYLKANEWMVQAFNNAQSVIQFQDKEQGAILGKYLLFSNKSRGLYGVESGSEIFAIIKVNVKDNASKITIEPQGQWYYDPSGLTVYNYSPEDAQNDINALIEGFENFMNKETDNW